jgi:hypothetical protein
MKRTTRIASGIRRGRRRRARVASGGVKRRRARVELEYIHIYFV